MRLRPGLRSGPRWGSLQRSLRLSVAGFKGAGASGPEGGEKGGKVKGGRGQEREERNREGGEGEGTLTLMHSWNRAEGWLRSALNRPAGFGLQ